MIPEHYNSTELADLCGISDRRIQQFVKMGLPKAGRGKYSARGCVQWIMNYYKVGGGEGKTQEEQRTELLYEQTIKTRMENEISKGNLFHADEVEASYHSAMTLLGSLHDAFAPRMANLLAGEHDPSIVKNILFEELREVRRAYATALQKVGTNMADQRGDSEAAATKDSKPVGGSGKKPTTRKPRTRKVAKQ